MLFVDLDGLKIINDNFGHGAGDEALIQVAALLGQGVRKSDLVARIGGDEFGILLANSDETQAQETALAADRPDLQAASFCTRRPCRSASRSASA